MSSSKNHPISDNARYYSQTILQNSPNRNSKCSASSSRYSLEGVVCDQNLIEYLSEAVKILKEDFKDGVEKDHFIDNVLEQTVGKEVELSCDHVASHYIEDLLENCNNSYALIRFMEAFSRNLSIVCMDQCASHIVEKVFSAGLSVVKNLSLVESIDVEEKEKMKLACFFWAYQLGYFCYQELEFCLSNPYGCHVLSAAIQILGCCHIEDSSSVSKKFLIKGHLQGVYAAGDENSFGVTEMLPAVPSVFKHLLKNITAKLVEYKFLSGLIFDSRSSAVIQTLLLILKKRQLKCFAKINQALLSVIFHEKDKEQVPVAFYDRSCSFLMEKLFGLAGEHDQMLIWMGINQNLSQLIAHPIGNYSVQHFFYLVHSKQQFESMFDSTVVHFENILENRYFGIWLTIAKSCNRFKTRQVQFLTKLMTILKCSKPEERNSCFAELLLDFMTYENYQKMLAEASQSHISMNLYGSLILQEILNFSKPVKVVRSILGMKVELLVLLVCHKQGCHVFISFLESMSISKKDKEKLIQQLKPALVTIACDTTGSLTLCRMWTLLSVDQKHVVAQELSNRKSELNGKCAAVLLKKFAIYHFEHQNGKWKQIQQSLAKKQKMLKEIVA